MINRKLLVMIMMRILRKQDTVNVWVVRHPDEIRYKVDLFAFEGFKFNYNAAQRTVELPNNNRILFVVEDEDDQRLMGLLIDEAIIDET